MSKLRKLCIHVPNPFTPTACMCDAEGSISDASHSIREEYISALNQEMLSASEDMDDYEVMAIVFDGGGIQVFSPNAFTDFAARIKRRFRMSKDHKTILTCDPYNIDHVKAANYLHLQPSLVDIRLFSSIKSECAAIGRVFAHHSLKQPAEALRSFHLNNIGVQVYCGLPEQTKDSLFATLDECKTYDVQHITLRQLNEDNRLFNYATDWLEKHGFERYADDRFAKAGFLFDFYPIGSSEVLGLGLGAISQMDGMHARNTADLDLYIKAMGDYSLIIETAAPLNN